MTQRRIYQEEYPYFITINTFFRFPVFEEVRLAEQLNTDIFLSCRIKTFIVYAFCIMPDHVHLLTGKDPQLTLERVRWGKGTDILSSTERVLSSTCSHVDGNAYANISDLLQSIKGNFSWKMKRGMICQRRFNSRIVNTERRLRNTILYIENNPIKADLPVKFQNPPYQFFNWAAIKQLF